MIDMTPEQFRALGYRAIDAIADRLAAVQTDAVPVRQPVPLAQREAWMHTPIPDAPTDPETLIDRVVAEIFPYPMGNASPRFFAWVNSTPAPMGILAELLAAAHNASVAGGDHAATYIEHGVLNALKSMFGFPGESGGILTSGGTLASVIPLAVMRHVQSGGNMRAAGFGGEAAQMVIYTSTQGHSCIQKAVELLGFGNDALRRIPVDGDYRMDIDALHAHIAADRAAGLRPVCVVASAGTVNTGAIDPLDAIADLCAEERLWFHIDGAYGGFGILAPEVAPLYAGIERADSLAIDPHKWLYIPIECGCALVRDAAAMRATFSVLPPYLQDDRALPWLSEFGIQQTRGFKALKLWLTLQHVGLDGYRELIAHDIRMAKTLQAKIRARADFRGVAAGALSITTFQYVPENGAMSPDAINALQSKIAARAQAEGHVFITTTILDGRTVLRACIVNFRTDEADLDVLLDTLAEAARVEMKTMTAEKTA